MTTRTLQITEADWALLHDAADGLVHGDHSASAYELMTLALAKAIVASAAPEAPAAHVLRDTVVRQGDQSVRLRILDNGFVLIDSVSCGLAPETLEAMAMEARAATRKGLPEVGESVEVLVDISWYAARVESRGITGSAHRRGSGVPFFECAGRVGRFFEDGEGKTWRRAKAEPAQPDCEDCGEPITISGCGCRHEPAQPGEPPACEGCGKPATCIGRYESEKLDHYSCDTCCGHGNEDGHCTRLSTAIPPAQPSEAAIPCPCCGQRAEHVAECACKPATPPAPHAGRDEVTTENVDKWNSTPWLDYCGNPHKKDIEALCKASKADIRANIARATAERDRTIAELQRQVESLQGQRDYEWHRRKQYQDDAGKFEAEAKQLRTQLDAAQGRVKGLEKAYEDLRIQHRNWVAEVRPQDQLDQLNKMVSTMIKERDAARAELETVKVQWDQERTAVRVALTKAGVPEVVPYPQEDVSDCERSLRTGGRVIRAVERIERLSAKLARRTELLERCRDRLDRGFTPNLCHEVDAELATDRPADTGKAGA